MSLDGDRGKNTGGMGAYSPAPVMTPELSRAGDEYNRAMPAISGDGVGGTGKYLQGHFVLLGAYSPAPVMITDAGPKVIEFNCNRLGDPEAQVLLTRMESDLVPMLDACIDGTLDKVECKWKSEVATCVVMASGGYPDPYETGKVITGLDRANALEIRNGFSCRNSDAKRGHRYGRWQGTRCHRAWL